LAGLVGETATAKSHGFNATPHEAHRELLLSVQLIVGNHALDAIGTDQQHVKNIFGKGPRGE
jgi:hypothetical protein